MFFMRARLESYTTWLLLRTNYEGRALTDACAAQRRDSDDAGTAKKPRVVWSAEMHQQFVEAVERLGVDSAQPPVVFQPRVCLPGN